ncbi:MAG: divalent metal cation transporter [Alphaproteobacteria bacterium]|nr:MAG: divalent metal cation transporter [Alphaproteobacteria bacterium]
MKDAHVPVRNGFWRFFGPGLLFAGTAVGTSHFVQSTRAGAVFGLGLMSVVILANLFKYPAFRFGAHYAAATGNSLVEGYRRQGKFPLWFLFCVLIAADGFAVAAISLVTAGILKAVLGISLGMLPLTGAVMLVVGAFLVVGHYAWLDRLNKLFMGLITFCTLLATAIALPHVSWDFYPATAPAMDGKTLMFIVALAGWMPTAVEVAVISSLWTVAKMGGQKPDSGHIGRVLADFDIGYTGTAILAVCFVLLGAGVLHAGGIQPADTAPGFAAQVIKLYESTLGAWATPVIGAAAIAVMFTTALTATDGITRALVACGHALRGHAHDTAMDDRTKAYMFTLLGVLVAAFLLLSFFLQSFQAFVDLATSIAFLTAPMLAWFTHRAVFGPDVAAHARPSRTMEIWSWVGMVVMAAFALLYLKVAFF